MSDLVIQTAQGLYCPVGDFYIDPWRPVERALITHAHGDHARSGSAHYLAASPGEALLRHRLGADAPLQTLPYGQALTHHGVRISFHPAGHVLGSAQIRLEHQGRVWVLSGDYKLAEDSTCAPFEPVACDVFVTESTFGLPIYRWESPATIFEGITQWWARNAAAGVVSVIYAYALGKAQRILSGVDAAIGPVLCHGAVENLNQAYRDSGVSLPPTERLPTAGERKTRSRIDGRALVVAPPSAAGSAWSRGWGEYSDAFASGWMQVRGARRRRGVDQGFVLSDHADWPALLQAIAASKAQRVIVTHGSVPILVRHLQELGLQASAFQTHYGDEDAHEAPVAALAEPEQQETAGKPEQPKQTERRDRAQGDSA